MMYLPNVLDSSSFEPCSPFTPLTTSTHVTDTATHQRSCLAGFIIVRVSNKLQQTVFLGQFYHKLSQSLLIHSSHSLTAHQPS